MRYLTVFMIILLILGYTYSQEKQNIENQENNPQPSDRNLILRTKYEDRLKVYPFSQKAFLPDISLIVNSSFISRNIKDEDLRNSQIPSIFNTGFTNQQGFNLNYTEMYIFAPVDPYFDLYSTIVFAEDGVEVEEAYATTQKFPLGLQLKLGKFRSSFGRLNSQHEHIRDFSNPPLIHKAVFGEEGLMEKGIQLNWLAPTPFYLLIGTEILQGENEQSFGTEPIEIGNQKIEEPQKPNLFVGFIKTSFDIENLSVLAGISYANGKSRFSYTNTNQYAFSGNTKIIGIDLTAKYFIDSYRYIALQNEYIFSNQKGQEYEYDGINLNIYNSTKKISGFYTQLVYKFDKRWKTGIQYNLISKNEIIRGNNIIGYNNLSAYYYMLEFNPTEFSRIRLQIGQDNSLYNNGNKLKLNEYQLQFTFAIGSHRAHPF